MADTETKQGKIDWKKLLIGTWDWKRPFKLIAFVYFTLLIIALFFANIFLFPAPPASYTDKTPGVEMLTTEDDTKIATRYWKTLSKEKGVILYFHGNAVDLGMLIPLAASLSQSGYSFQTMDYRGYGLSQGSPTEQNCYQDAELVYQKLLDQGYKPEQIILWGRSLGGGIATELASRKQIKALILESTFCTAFRTATVIPLLPFDKFNNLKKMPTIEEPILFLHGAKDQVIPPWHSEKLQKAHQGENHRLVMPNTGHDNLWNKNHQKILNHLNRFIATKRSSP